MLNCRLEIVYKLQSFNFCVDIFQKLLELSMESVLEIQTVWKVFVFRVFWSIFCRIRTECGEIRNMFLQKCSIVDVWQYPMYTSEIDWIAGGKCIELIRNGVDCYSISGNGAKMRYSLKSNLDTGYKFCFVPLNKLLITYILI